MKDGPILVTGGAGFIGSNLAARYLSRGYRVRVLDNLSRRGTTENLHWLRAVPGGVLEFIQGDVRDYGLVKLAAADVQMAIHMASQVAVTTSVSDPRLDFEVNTLGTFNLLEAVRAAGRQATVIFASTNKVYGGMDGVVVQRGENGYSYRDLPHGVSEVQPLDFHSPYGCSKGSADQYVRDYHRIYGIPTVVFRQSCVCGPRQLGNENQGWLAHFALSALAGRPVTIYGDGYQVRDILYVDDLVRAVELAAERVRLVAGEVYNIGGGPENALSLRGLVRLLEDRLGARLSVQWADWRPGDQRVYVSDTRKAKHELGWNPTVGTREAVHRLVAWLEENPWVVRLAEGAGASV